MTMQTTGGQTDCEQLRDLLPAYSIGALDADEAAQVEALLPNCPEVAEDARAYARLARALHYSAPEAALAVRPPDDLRERILKESALASAFLQQSRAKTALPPQKIESGSTPRPAIPLPMPEVLAKPVTTRRPSALRVGLAIAAALLLVSNIYWILQIETNRRDQDTLRDALAIIASPDAHGVDLVSTDGNVALARVSWQPNTDTAVLQTSDIPPLDAGRAYQLWLIPADGAPISAGVFQAGGDYTLIFTHDLPLNEFAALGITEEPAGGSPAPTSDPVAVGTLA